MEGSAWAASSTLASGQILTGGQEIAAGGYVLVMQGDGNLVEYGPSGAIWQSFTSGQPGNYLVMQTDGNLVMYHSGGGWVWQTFTNGYPGDHLSIQTDGNFVVYSGGNSPLWVQSWNQLPAGAQAFSQVLFPHFGWGSNQFTYLNELWNRESGWRWNATNPTSGAYGIPQSLPANKMAAYGPDWVYDDLTQVAWGEAYISAAYGTPQAAWAHELSYGWYAVPATVVPAPVVAAPGVATPVTATQVVAAPVG
jgi:hypothetical protein